MLIGPPLPIPVPASPDLIQSIKSIEITNTDEGRDGFEITFAIGRSGPLDLLGYQILKNPLIREGNRVIIQAFFGFVPKVLIDGIITLKQVSAGEEPGQSTLKLTGQDVSCLMDAKQTSKTRPNMPDPAIVTDIISGYMQYGMIPAPTIPTIFEVPIMLDRIPTQRSTDFEYLKEMANSTGYVFYVEPGPAPGVSTAYWGPPQALGLSQKALTVNMGADTNVGGTISFQENPLNPVLVEGSVQDRLTNQSIPVRTFTSTEPPLSLMPAWLVNYANLRTEQYTGNGGVSAIQAMAQAQGRTNSSSHVVRGTGELDAARYGDVLRARKPVDVRGMGLEHDGMYYVKSVTHKIKRGEYKQSFTITRDGEGSTIPAVMSP